MSEWSSSDQERHSEYSVDSGSAGGETGVGEPPAESVVDRVEQAWDSTVEQVEQAWDSTVVQVEQAWDRATGGSASSGPLPQDGLTSDLRVRTDFELQVLGGCPPEAARQWPTLDDASKTRVLELMASKFGAGFAQTFAATPTDLRQHYDTIHNVAPSTIEAQGFVASHFEGSYQIYYHPSGQTFHLKVFFHSSQPDDPGSEPEQPEPPEPPGPGDDNEAVIAAREWADFLATWKTSIPSDLQSLEQQVSRPGYAESYRGLTDSWNELDNNLNRVEAGTDAWREQAGDCAPALERQVDRIHGVRQWRDQFSATFWSRLGRLPSP